MRFRIYHLPARLAAHARRRWPRIDRTWPWANAFTTGWHRLTKHLKARPPPTTRTRKEQRAWAVEPGTPAATCDHPTRTALGHYAADPISDRTLLTNRGQL